MTGQKEKGSEPVDPRMPLPDSELGEQAFILIADFRNCLEVSDEFEDATTALYFGLTDSGEPADRQDRVVSFWVPDENGNDTIRWDISYHFGDAITNEQELMARRSSYDIDQKTELKFERLDLKTKRFRGFQNGPKSSIEYRSDSSDKIPETARSNSRNAVNEAKNLLDKLAQDTDF